MSRDLELCQARIQHPRPDGTDRCRRQATHEHLASASGTRYELCTQHYNALAQRERLGSPSELVDAWDTYP